MAYPLHRPALSEPSSSSSEPQGVPASPDLPALEQDVLAYWKADGTFVASVEAREAGPDGSNEFVFYD
ncbi:hypothetical protein KQ753_15670, partial [Listeria monocytogenes]|nr:hypothetical protein [Listeria monocytogenes]